MRYWLMKSEPSSYSIDDLVEEGITQWEGIRNYQARNFMRDKMKIGDQALFYHSSCKVPGVVGMMEVCREAYPDHFAWDTNSQYFDPKASKENPIWQMVDLKLLEKFPRIVSLEEIRHLPGCSDMLLLKKGQRLSVQPIEKHHFKTIVLKSKENDV